MTVAAVTRSPRNLELQFAGSKVFSWDKTETDGCTILTL